MAPTLRIASLVFVTLTGPVQAGTQPNPPTPSIQPGSSPSAGSRPPVDEVLRKELLAMAREDQLDSVAADPGAPAIAAQHGLWPPQVRLARIKEIVAQHGWPGKSLVGEDGAHAAWILVQHADTDPLFQRDCLDPMRTAFEAGEVTAQELSFLTDRVMQAEGKPQVYGTQGAFHPTPEEETQVDMNRALIGLEPWRVFIERRRKPHEAWLPDPK